MRAAVLQEAATTFPPGGAERVRFGDVLSEPLRNGHSAKADPNGTVPIFTLTAVTLADFSQRNIKMTAADPGRVRDLWVQPGDLLIERSNTRELVGTARLYRGPGRFAVFPDLVIRARVDKRIQPEFAELVLQAPNTRRYFQRRAQGISGTMPKIDQSAIADLIIPAPPIEVQRRSVNVAARQLSLIEAIESAVVAANRRSAALRSTILAAVFSGELVAQDPGEEPASILLGRIAAERATSNGHTPSRPRKPRTKVTT